MRTALQVDISYDQVLALVRQLPMQEKLQLSKALEADCIESKLSRLLKAFRTDKLSLDTIDEEAEAVRTQMHERNKH